MFCSSELGSLKCVCSDGRLPGVWLVSNGHRGNKSAFLHVSLTTLQQPSWCVFVAAARAEEKQKCKTPVSSLCLRHIFPILLGQSRSHVHTQWGSLFYCCVTNCYKLGNEKQHTFLNLTISIGQKLEHALTGSSHRLESKYGREPRISSGTWDHLPNSYDCWQTSDPYGCRTEVPGTSM